MRFLFWGGFFVWLSAILLILAMLLEIVGVTINIFSFFKYVFILGIMVCIFVDKNKFSFFYSQYYNIVLFFMFVGWIPYINYIIKLFLIKDIENDCLWDINVVLFGLSSILYLYWARLEKNKKCLYALLVVLLLLLYSMTIIVDF